MTSTLPSNTNSLNSNAMRDKAMEDPSAEAPSDNEFVYIDSISSSQKDEAMKGLSLIAFNCFHSFVFGTEQEQASLGVLR